MVKADSTEPSLSSDEVTDGLRWSAVANIATRVIGFGRALALARIAGPQAFGLFAGVFAFAAAGSVVSELGLRTYLMHRGADALREARIVGRIAISAALLAAVLLLALAIPIARLYDDPSASAVAVALAAWLLIGGCGLVPNSVIRAQRRFREAAKAQVSGEIAGLSTGLLLAAGGARVWALVGAILASQLTSVGIVYMKTRGQISAATNSEPAGLVQRRALRYGLTITAGSALWAVALQGDNVAVGHVAGTTALGLYAFAYNYGLLPGTFVGSTVSEVALVAFSHAVNNAERRRLFLRFLRIGALVGTPIVFIGLVLTPAAIDIVLGSTWVPASNAVRAMLIVGWIRGLAPTESLLRSLGMLDVEVRFGAIAAPVTILAAYVGANTNVPTTAALVGFVLTCAGLAIAWIAVRAVGIRLNDVAAATWASTAISSVIAISLFLAAEVFDVDNAVAVIGLGPLALLIYGAALHRLRPGDWSELRAFRQHATDRAVTEEVDGELPTLVVLGHYGWNAHFMQFHKLLCAEIARRGFHVVWVDERVRVRAVGARQWVSAFPWGIASREGSLWLLRPWTLPGERFSDRVKIPAVIVACSVRRFLRHQRLRCDILLAYTPAENEVIRRLKHDALVYWTGDEVTAANEDWLVKQADVVLAVSDLAASQKTAAKRVYRVSTGVPVDRFSIATPVPPEIGGLHRPIFGYAGALTHRRVDLDLLCALADRYPSATVLAVGPEYEEFAEGRALPRNLVRLGARDFSEMPAFMQAFDVGLVPYILNEFNRGSDPLKVHEYLAAGLPVVATNLPALAQYAGLIDVAYSTDDFCDAALRLVSLRHDTELVAMRRRAAAGYGIDAVAENVVRIFDGLGLRGGQPPDAATL
ncbi:MAG TPA: oligosaccharide flippase family protein [Acidimicrobiales bacterium]|nr:oligosaccharide flippase family protein [Acidimicrobiales bacterium]